MLFGWDGAEVAARRAPCYCLPCHTQLQEPWVQGVKTSDQPRFQTPAECQYRAVLGHYNDWKIITLRPKVKKDEDAGDDESTATEGDDLAKAEMRDLFEDFLLEHEAVVSSAIEEHTFGAYHTAGEDDDAGDYNVIQWTSLPFRLTADSHVVQGIDGTVEAGTLVCLGKYWYKQPSTTNWYYPDATGKSYMFRLRYVVVTDLVMEAHSETVPLPQRLNKEGKAKFLKLGPKRLAPSSQQDVAVAIARRALIDYVETNGVDLHGDSDDSWEEDSSSSDDDSSTGSESE
jgi:hypothetical protein